MSKENHYDLLVVGAGLFGSVIAHEAAAIGRRVLVLEKRNHIGGNCYTKNIDGINVHLYGAHIFRTDSEYIWNYIRQFCQFNNFINCPIANYRGELFNLPFNMNTFHALWGVNTPSEAKAMIDSQRVACEKPQNLEEHILNLVGRDIYDKLVRGYTEKQWGKPCAKLPPSIMRRIPLRFTYDNNYFNAFYQGIPIGGYTPLFGRMLEGIEVRLGIDFLDEKSEWLDRADLVLYTGAIDEYYDYCYGPLEYRSLRFEHQRLDEVNHQGVAVMNYTDYDTPYTRIIEHKHFEKAEADFTIISREYPAEWNVGAEPFYPMEDKDNRMRYEQYLQLSKNDQKVTFGGRLGEYRYYDMQDTVLSALTLAKEILKG